MSVVEWWEFTRGDESTMYRHAAPGEIHKERMYCLNEVNNEWKPLLHPWEGCARWDLLP